MVYCLANLYTSLAALSCRVHVSANVMFLANRNLFLQGKKQYDTMAMSILALRAVLSLGCAMFICLYLVILKFLYHALILYHTVYLSRNIVTSVKLPG